MRMTKLSGMGERGMSCMAGEDEAREKATGSPDVTLSDRVSCSPGQKASLGAELLELEITSDAEMGVGVGVGVGSGSGSGSGVGSGLVISDGMDIGAGAR